MGIRVLVTVLWTAACLPATVAAQDDAAEARRHFDAGVESFQAGRYAEALDAFRDAYRVRPHPSVLVNMANCYMGMGRPVEAGQHFERYLREAEDIDPERRAEVERALGQARLAIATVEIHGPPGSTVFLDGAALGQTPLRRPAEVNPGQHVVELRQPDGSVQQQRVQVEAGGHATVGGQPTEDAAGPASTSLDAPRRTAVGAGAASATAVGGGPGAAPDDAGGGLGVPLATWIAGGVAVAALGAGIVFGLTATSQQSEFDAIVADIEALPPRHPDVPQLQADGESVADAQSTNALVADLMFVTAAVAAGVAAYFFVTRDDGEGEAGTSLGAAASPSGAALILSQRF